MKVSFFQYQNGLNNGEVINWCGLFLIINFCSLALRLLLPHDTRQVLQRHIKLQSGAAQKLYSGAKKSQSGADITKWGKNYKVGHNKSHSIKNIFLLISLLKQNFCKVKHCSKDCLF